MNWRRVHLEGKDPKHFKEWRGGRGHYRITWRDRVWGVTVTPGFHATFLEGYWALIDRKRPLKRTLRAAKRACELHANPPKKRK